MDRNKALAEVQRILQSVSKNELPAWQLIAIQPSGTAEIIGVGCNRCMAHFTNRISAYTLATTEACETVPALDPQVTSAILQLADVSEPHSGGTH